MTRITSSTILQEVFKNLRVFIFCESRLHCPQQIPRRLFYYFICSVICYIHMPMFHQKPWGGAHGLPCYFYPHNRLGWETDRFMHTLCLKAEKRVVEMQTNLSFTFLPHQEIKQPFVVRSIRRSGEALQREHLTQHIYSTPVTKNLEKWSGNVQLNVPG